MDEDETVWYAHVHGDSVWCGAFAIIRPIAVETGKVMENSEMGDKKSNAKGVSPHLIRVVAGMLMRESRGPAEPL